MAYWLLKTEPGTYSYDDLAREGTTRWDGVRSPAALRHIRTMAPGDRCIIYHSGTVRAAVGLAEVTTEPYADPEAGDPKLAVVDVRALGRLREAVALATIKANPLFAASPLLRESRLSVVPLTEGQYRAIAGG
ncbi:MAG TPA: EVE domain-containing protein [Chloroflexota bacterium]|nr:EVE domain-containing protein [Chloroflexota bacterium]